MWLVWTRLALGQSLPDEALLSGPEDKRALSDFRYDLPYSYEEARPVWLARVTERYPEKGGSLTRKDTDKDLLEDWWDMCPYQPRIGDSSADDFKVGCPPGVGWTDYGIPERPRKGEESLVSPPAPQAPSDSDGDGLLDESDRCVTESEDKDGFQDEDGCPDPDNDLDGITDASDKCPGEAETINAFQDEDGCPDAKVAELYNLSPKAPDPASLGWSPQPAQPQPAPVTEQRPFGEFGTLRPLSEILPAPTRKALPDIDAPLRTGGRASRDSAVVIGIEDYAFVQDVPYARRDADAFYNFLLYSRGVPSDRIRTLSSAALEHIRAAIESAGREVGPGGRVWVYFAGHGAASPTTRERLLLGDDVRADATSFESRAMPVSEVQRLASVGGGEVVLVLDTCFAGVGRSGDTLLAGQRISVPAFVAPAQRSVFEWNAAGPNQLSGPLDEARHGAFTYFAIGALRGWADGEISGVRDGQVTAEEAQAYVARALKVLQIREQAPVWVGSGGSGVVLSTGATERGPEL